MERDETLKDDETKTTMKVPSELLDDLKPLAVDMKTTATSLIVESMRQFHKTIKKK